MRAEALSSKFHDGQMRSFWRDLRSLNPKTNKIAQRVDEAVGDDKIAELWRSRYDGILNSIDDHKYKESYEMRSNGYELDAFDIVSVEEVGNIVKSLASNKSVGLDRIPNEFYRFAPNSILVWLTVFFNSFISHGYLPNSITSVSIVPLLKCKLKDSSQSDNYRPIAIATAISKVFENILLNRMVDYLETSNNQFGFKAGHSTDLCIYAIKEVIGYYRDLNTPVFICFVDIKSAFDRLSYWCLFVKLLDRGMPFYLVRILQYWYCSQQLYVRWGSACSTAFRMGNGIRQGSCLSPLLFNVYVDDLNHRLNSSGIGCHIAGKPTNNFAYADDLAIVCPSTCALNELLSICQLFANDHHIIYSPTKSVCMRILPGSDQGVSLPGIYLNDSKLAYVDTFTYLGHIITKEFKDDDDIQKETRKLCARGNTLIRTFKFANKDVKCNLFKTYCYSLYCAPLWCRNKVASLNRLRVTYNNILRKLLDVPPWESASRMCVTANVMSFQELKRNVVYNCMSRILDSTNDLIKTLNNSDVKRNDKLWQCWHGLLHVNHNT